MPQPIPFRSGAAAFHSFPRVLLERPKLAALIGAIAAGWGHIDYSLVDIYDAAISEVLNGGGRYVNSLNMSVFETLGALGPKLDIIEVVLKMRVPPPIPNDFIPLRKKLRQSAGERARYVHANWNISDDFPDDLIVTSRNGNLRYQRHDFEKALDRAIAVRLLVHDFVIKVSCAPRIPL